MLPYLFRQRIICQFGICRDVIDAFRQKMKIGTDALGCDPGGHLNVVELQFIRRTDAAKGHNRSNQHSQ